MIDPIAAARQQEDTDRLPFIAIEEFWTDYDPQPDGKMRPIEKVRWAKKGVQNGATTIERVARLMKDPENVLWQVIKPHYERWKQGQDAPVDGTPLAAWPGATPQLVKALEPANIRSVEDLARIEDSAIQRLGVPNLRKLKIDAQAFLRAQESTAGVAAENAKLKETVEYQAKELAELKALVTELAAKDGVQIVEDQPKRRGRPPKQKPEIPN